jgi:hypothetical protein
MHGLNTIIRLNRVQQDFVDEILLRPVQDVNLLDAWRAWKEEQNQEQRVYADEPVQVHSV